MTQEPQVPAGPDSVTAQLLNAKRAIERGTDEFGPRMWLLGAAIAAELGLPGPGAYEITVGMGEEIARWKKL